MLRALWFLGCEAAAANVERDIEHRRSQEAAVDALARSPRPAHPTQPDRAEHGSAA